MCWNPSIFCWCLERFPQIILCCLTFPAQNGGVAFFCMRWLHLAGSFDTSCHFAKMLLFLQMWYLYPNRLGSIYGCIFFHALFSLSCCLLQDDSRLWSLYSSDLFCACLFFRGCGVVTWPNQYHLVFPSALAVRLFSGLTLLWYFVCFFWL